MGKHFEKNPKKVNLKPILICLTILIIIVIGIYFSKNFEDEETKIKNIINNTFSSLKMADIKEVNKYMKYNKLVSSIDEMILEENNGTVSNLEKKLFDSMEWKINSITIEENVIVVNIEMKNKNFKEIFAKWIEKIIEEKQKDINVSKDIALKILENIISENKDEKKVTKDIVLEKQENKFEIIVDNNLRNLIFPGIESVATVINEK